MSGGSSSGDKRDARDAAPANDREIRLKAALKANMAKRKAQARARAGQAAEPNETERDQD